ncbi:hypothetical protein LOCC1_G005061 [Lachnellula occidentalis]|uniref:Uncharacterized protein n=1 Tax=Lachnellula occidentalis TaxID=215460 RepID=A0A8H8RWA3_9HELO|nr:hypothetical protein LOCC1_G005061 [Lachnellula occidentalis]
MSCVESKVVTGEREEEGEQDVMRAKIPTRVYTPASEVRGWAIGQLLSPADWESRSMQLFQGRRSREQISAVIVEGMIIHRSPSYRKQHEGSQRSFTPSTLRFELLCNKNCGFNHFASISVSGPSRQIQSHTAKVHHGSSCGRAFFCTTPELRASESALVLQPKLPQINVRRILIYPVASAPAIVLLGYHTMASHCLKPILLNQKSNILLSHRRKCSVKMNQLSRNSTPHRSSPLPFLQPKLHILTTSLPRKIHSIYTQTMKISRIIAAALSTTLVIAGPAAYGICQGGCATLAVACYSAAGATFGTVVAAPAAPAVILTCNAALGTCYATCAALLIAPTL